MARPVCHPARPRRRAHQGLNSQTARSNVASTTLRKARGSITRSEKDVAQLEVNTADGRTLDVSTAQVGVLGDVAFVTVDGTLPVNANLEGRTPEGADVAAVGYPLGGPFTITRGGVIDRIDGFDFNVPGDILRISAEVQPGNSGGPLLDRRGRVAGVVYAIEIATGLGLAIPMDTVDALIDDGGLQAVPACGQE